MKTITKEEKFKIIIDAIRMAERHYPEKVVIKKEDYGLKIYSPSGTTFMNTDIIATVIAMKANNHIIYDEDLNKVILVIF